VVHACGAAGTEVEGGAINRTKLAVAAVTEVGVSRTSQVPASSGPCSGCQPSGVHPSWRQVPFARISTAPPLCAPKIDGPVHWSHVPTRSCLRSAGFAGVAGADGGLQVPGGCVSPGEVVVGVLRVVVGDVVTVGAVVERAVLGGSDTVVVGACVPLCVVVGVVDDVGAFEDGAVPVGCVAETLELVEEAPVVTRPPEGSARGRTEPANKAATAVVAAAVPINADMIWRLRSRRARRYTWCRNASGSLGRSGGSVPSGNLGLPGIAEGQPKGSQPSLQVSLHGADRYTHRPGDLCFTEIEVVTQHESVPLSPRDGEQRGVEVEPVVDRARPMIRAGADKWRPPFGLPEVADRQVRGDGHNPAAQVGGVGKRLPAHKSAGQHLGGDVLRLLPVTEEPPSRLDCHGEQLIEVTLEALRPARFVHIPSNACLCSEDDTLRHNLYR
jgi:hypothetical protein